MQIINNNRNTSCVGLCKDAPVHSLIHKHMREGYMWMIIYVYIYSAINKDKKIKLYCGKLYAPNMTDRDDFSD